MKAAQYDLYLEQGASFKLPCMWKNHDGAPVDLSGVSFAIKIRPTKDSTTILLYGTYDGATDSQYGDIRITENGAEGTFMLNISASALEVLDFTQGVYDLEAITDDGTFRLIEGVVRFSKEVTRG